jgi:hypothetical protein
MRASQSAANKGHFTELDHKGGRLLAWIRGQVRLKAFTAQQEGLIYRRRHSLVLIGDKGEPIRGELKHK